MDYQRIYNEFIADRIEKQNSLTGYFEKHHIKPRSHGGSNSKNNIVKLSASDHYFAHKLLAKIYGGGMIRALVLMSRPLSNSAKFKKTRKDYEYVKKHYSDYLKRMNKGENNPRFGKKCTDKTKRLIAEANAEYVWKKHPRAINKKHIWVNKNNGDIFIGSHFDVSEAYSLSRNTLRAVSKGRIFSYKGWMCVTSGRENLREGLNGNTSDKNKYKWLSPDGDIVESTRYHLSKEYNLNSYRLGLLIGGKHKTHKGWRFYSEN